MKIIMEKMEYFERTGRKYDSEDNLVKPDAETKEKSPLEKYMMANSRTPLFPQGRQSQ